MQIGNAVDSILQSDMTDSTNEIKAKVQISLLRKSLSAQQTEADAIMQLLSGLGQNLDIRA